MALTSTDLIHQEVLFTRQNLEHIGQRFAAYLLQRQMPVNAAWQQAVEDEAELIGYKLELMEEGALKWDWPGLQLAAMHREIQHMTEEEKAANQ